MKAFLLIGCFVAVWGLGIRDWGLERRGDAIAAALNTRSLLSFDPKKVAESYKLQGVTNPAACGAAWGVLANMLNASLEPCAEVLLIFKGVNTLSPAANMFLLDRYCTNCTAKYEEAWTNMTTACNGFAPAFAAQTPIGNQTDMIARTIKALITAPCLNISQQFDADPTPDPRSSLLPQVPATSYPVTYCWVHYAMAVQVDLNTVTEGQLNNTCTQCAHDVASVLDVNGVTALAFAARQSISYCLKRAGVYCALRVQTFRIAAADPQFQTRIQAQSPTTQDLMTACDWCVKWGIQLAAHIMTTLHKLELAQNQTLGYNATLDTVLKSATDLLSISCDRDGDGNYCVMKLSKWTANAAELQSKFLSCFSPGCGKQKKGTPDYCRQNLTAIYRDVGCCLGTFVRSLKLPAAQAQISGADQLVGSILSNCQWKVPQTCSQKKNLVMFRLKNINIAWISNVVAKDANALPAWFAATLGIDPQQIDLPIQCQGMASDNSTTCNVTIMPNQTPDAEVFVTDFENNKAAGMIRVTELDSADLASNAFLDPSQPAYDPNDFVASSMTSCIQATPPVDYQYNASTDSCDPMCSNGIMDQDETDVDCGGVGCNECAVGKKCLIDSDCVPVNATKKVVCNPSKHVCAYSGATTLIVGPLVFLITLFGIFLM